MVTNCFWLLKKMLDFTNRKVKDLVLFSNAAKRDLPLVEEESKMPTRRADVNFSLYSSVTGKELTCGRDSRFEVWGTKGYILQLMGRNKKLPGYPTVHLAPDLVNVALGLEKAKVKEPSLQVVSNKTTKIGKSVDFFGFIGRQEVTSFFESVSALGSILAYWFMIADYAARWAGDLC